MKFGFNKLNGRYLWIAAVISVTLLAVTFYAQNLVTDSAQDGYSVIQEYQTASASIQYHTPNSKNRKQCS